MRLVERCRPTSCYVHLRSGYAGGAIGSITCSQHFEASFGGGLVEARYRRLPSIYVMGIIFHRGSSWLRIYCYLRYIVCLLQLEEQLVFDARMHMAVDEMGKRLAEEADAQLLERKR